MKLPVLALTILLTTLSFPSRAAIVTLGELLDTYRQAGFNVVYSTDIVNERQTVEWQRDQLGIRRLAAILQPLDLALQSVGKRRWVITKRSTSKTQGASAPSILPHDYIEHIIVTASQHEISGHHLTSRFAVTDAQMEQTPAFASDSLRIIHRLPGAASIGVSSKPNIRGGNNDELLVMFDGVELIEPFHLRDFQSLLSTINPQTIRDIEYFTGGFPAQYGNKISGVLDIATKDTFEAPGGEIGISTFQAAGLFFGESGGNQWLASARRGNLDLLLNRVNPSLGKPRYHDLYGKFSRDTSAGRIEVSALGFFDDVRLNTDEIVADSDIDNRYLWARWSREFNDAFFASTVLSSGEIDSRRRGQTMAEDRTEGTLVDRQHLDIRTIVQSFEWRANDALRLTAGLSASDMDMSYQTQLNARTGTIAELLGNPVQIQRNIDRNIDGNRVGSHLSAKLQATRRLTIQSGFRLDWQSYLDVDTEFQFSPRMALLYTPTSNLLVRLSYGRFHQPPGIHELETADGRTTFSDIQRAHHWIAGLEYQWGKSSSVELEIFFKSIKDPKRRYENLFNPYVLLPELEPDRIQIVPEEAYAKGAELSYQARSGDFTWMVNYSFSKVQDKVDNRWIYRRWDQTHNLNIMGNWRRGSWLIGVAGVWHTGWAMTVLPEELATGEFSVSGYRNNGRIKDYATLDVRVAYEHPFAKSTLTGFVEITNLVSRANKGGVDYEISREGDVYLLEEVDLEPVFPLVTSLGIIWRF